MLRHHRGREGHGSATRDWRDSSLAFLCAAPAFPSEMITFDRMAELGLREMQAGQALVPSFYFEPSRVWARERLEAQRQFFEAAAREVGRGAPRAGWLSQDDPS
jgi:hypothetical protein